MLSGHFFGEIDPQDPHNSIIMDIQFAPRNARGMVEYSATFALSKPIDMSKSNGVLYYTVSNRGRGAPVGSDDGRINLLSGWQGDLLQRPDAQTIVVPWRASPMARRLTGPVMERLIDIAAGHHHHRSRHDALRGPDLPAPAHARHRQGQPHAAHRPRMRRPPPSPSGDWAFADCTTKPFPGTPDPSKLCVKGGFDPASEYVLVFTAKDPLVLGIGFAATRDLNSFLRYADAGRHRHAQPARQAAQVGDQPRRFAVRQLHPQLHSPGLQPGRSRAHRVGRRQSAYCRAAARAQFSLRGGRRLRGRVSARQRGRAVVERLPGPRRGTGPRPACWTAAAPPIPAPRFSRPSARMEFWFLRESPDLVGTDAKSDIPLPPNVRRYFFPGNDARRRPGRFQHRGSAAAQRLRAAGESQSGKRHHARPDRGFDRLGRPREPSRRRAAIRAWTSGSSRRPPRPPSGSPTFPAHLRPTAW